MANPILRFLRGSNLEIFKVHLLTSNSFFPPPNLPKFGLYLSFPIGWMYYFGTNLDRKFSIPDFWPTQEQSHRIPTEKEDIRREVERIREGIKERKIALLQAKERGEGSNYGGGGDGGDGKRILEMKDEGTGR
jgi:protein PET100, fungi type